MNDFESIVNKLNLMKVEFEVIEFQNEAIAARTNDDSIGHNYNPENAIKTLVVKGKDGLVAAIIKGSEKVDDKKLENIIGKWTVVNSEVLLKELGFIPGTVCPLVLDIPIFIDKSIMKMEILSMGAGDNKKGLNVKLREILKVLKFNKVDIRKNNMETEEKIKLITRNCQEVLTEDDLKTLVDSGKTINHYIGFEISGLVHLGTGLMSMGKIADFLQAGVKCRIFLADFHTFLNNKLGGNWEDIRWASDNYFKQALIASLLCFGVDESQVEFISGKKLYEDNPGHWETFMRVGKHITLSRNLRSISIMGKKQGTDVDMATLFYPPLQVADIFTMNISLAHAGMDQRKAHVVAREVGSKLNLWTPIAIHQNLIAGLTAPDTDSQDEDSLKMSKSKPNSAIFIHDTPDEIREKIKKAYGPPKEVEFNPLLNWVKTLVFWGDEEGLLQINRPEKFGGNITYTKYSEVVADYAGEKLFPTDLKNALALWLIEKLEPARKYFEIPEHKEALEKMKDLLSK